MQHFQALADELRDVELVAAGQSGDHHLREPVEVLLAFAAAGVDAEPRGIDLVEFDARVGHRLLRGADGEVGVPALILPILGILAHVGNVPIANFGGDLRGEIAGVEERGIADARLAGQQPPPHGFNIGPQRRHAADAGHYNTSSHNSVLLASVKTIVRQVAADFSKAGELASMARMASAS